MCIHYIQECKLIKVKKKRRKFLIYDLIELYYPALSNELDNVL